MPGDVTTTVLIYFFLQSAQVSSPAQLEAQFLLLFNQALMLALCDKVEGALRVLNAAMKKLLVFFAALFPTAQWRDTVTFDRDTTDLPSLKRRKGQDEVEEAQIKGEHEDNNNTHSTINQILSCLIADIFGGSGGEMEVEKNGEAEEGGDLVSLLRHWQSERTTKACVRGIAQLTVCFTHLYIWIGFMAGKKGNTTNYRDILELCAKLQQSEEWRHDVAMTTPTSRRKGTGKVLDPFSDGISSYEYMLLYRNCERSPTYHVTCYLQGLQSFTQGDTEAAMRSIAESLIYCPLYCPSLYIQGKFLHDDGDKKDAETTPYLGCIYFQQQDIGKAIECFNHYVQHQGQEIVHALNMLALCFGSVVCISFTHLYFILLKNSKNKKGKTCHSHSILGTGITNLCCGFG